jgi:hypothetical protein
MASEAISSLNDDEIIKLKDEVEAKTGKKYKIREPRQNINDLLVVGALQDAPTTFWEAIKMGLLLALAFLLSFGMYYILFFQFPSKNRKGKSDLFKPSRQYNIKQPMLNEDTPIKPKLYMNEF